MKARILLMVVIAMILGSCAQTSSSMEEVIMNNARAHDFAYPTNDIIEELNQYIVKKYPFINRVGIDNLYVLKAVDINKNFNSSLSEELYCFIQDYYIKLQEYVQKINSNKVKYIVKTLYNDSIDIHHYNFDDEFKILNGTFSFTVYLEGNQFNYATLNYDLNEGRVNYNLDVLSFQSPIYHPINQLLIYDFGPFVCKACLNETEYNSIKTEFANLKRFEPIRVNNIDNYLSQFPTHYTKIDKTKYEEYLREIDKIKEKYALIDELIDVGNLSFALDINKKAWGDVRVFAPQLYIALERNDYNWELENEKVIKEIITQTTTTNYFSVLLYDNYTNDKTEPKNKQSFLLKVYVYDDKDSLNYYSFVYEYFLIGSQKGKLNLISKNYIDFKLD